LGTVDMQLKGPKGLPLIGNLLSFRKDPLGFLTKAAEEYGDIIPFRFGPRYIYLLKNPEHIKEVLLSKQNHFKKAKGLQTAKAVVGDGILTSEGEKHIRQRRLMQPHFQPKKISSYAEDMVQKSQTMLQTWADGEERIITDDMMKLTLAIIVKTMFSIDVKEDSLQGIHNIGHAIEVGMKYVARKSSSFIDIPEKIPNKSKLEFHESKRLLDVTIFSIIKDRRQSSANETNEDLLSMLLAAKDSDDGTGMSDEQVRDEVMTIFLAGHETTANTLSWTWYLLSLHPEVEQKFSAELDAVLGGNPPTVDDLKNLPYLNNLIWESMRLYPAVWAVNREVVETVEIGGHTFKPGETLMMSQYVMHRNSQFFENPLKFDPGRFDGNLLKQIPQYAYFPFGGGPRICIGNHFALMEAALLLATIGQRYKLRLIENHPPVEPEPLITLRPKGGLRMIISKRM
jgi:cytochrome P450